MHFRAEDTAKGSDMYRKKQLQAQQSEGASGNEHDIPPPQQFSVIYLAVLWDYSAAKQIAFLTSPRER